MYIAWGLYIGILWYDRYRKAFLVKYLQREAMKNFVAHGRELLHGNQLVPGEHILAVTEAMGRSVTNGNSHR